MEATNCKAVSIKRPYPSFEISDANNRPYRSIEWDRVNSKSIIKKARNIYFLYLTSKSNNLGVKGIIINKKDYSGRVVFSIPTLLPDEYFLSMEQINLKSTKRIYK